MILVLAHGSDLSALWAYERLRARRGAGDVELCLVEWLDARSTRWRHGFGAEPPATEVALADGRRLRTGAVAAVLNRMLQPPVGVVAAAAPEDADYARSELTSFAASWLRALAARVVNPATPQGLSGRWRPAMHWRELAVRARLPAAPLVLDSDDPEPMVPYGYDERRSTTVLVIGGEALAAGMPVGVRDGVRRLAALAETPVLGLRFDGEDPAREGWHLLDATPYPDLGSGGEDGVAALEELLAA